jgi:hypothetical protein
MSVMGVSQQEESRVMARTRMLVRVLAVAGSSAVVLAGCGSSGTPSAASSAGSGATASSGGGTPNACTVLSPALAKSTLSASVHRTIKAQPNPHETHCQYQSHTGAVDVMVGDWTFINLGGAGSPADPAKPVSGIGDQAYITSTDLVVRKGNEGIELDVTPMAGSFSGDAATQQQRIQDAMEKKLALKLVGRL